MRPQLLLALGMWTMALGCSSPTYFSFQRLNFFDNTSSQAQLGNMGVIAVDGDGFLRGAFLSDCGIGEIELTVDSRVPHFSTVTSGFSVSSSLKVLESHLGYRSEQLERMSVVVVSLNPLKLTKWLKQSANSECKNYLAMNGDAMRVITAVALLIDLPILQSTTAKLQLEARLTTQGRIALKVGDSKKSTEVTLAANAVFAYRYAQVCWRDSTGEDFLFQVDDASFEECPPGYSTGMPGEWDWSRIKTGAADSQEALSPGGPEDAPSDEPPAKKP